MNQQRTIAGARGAITRVLLGGTLLLGCTVGDGRGEAKGKLYYKDCKINPTVDYGRLDAPADFDLGADFFTGEPIEDIKPNGSDNRLVVRMQNAGRRLEDNDLLVFDMDSWRVAQCLRGVPEVLETPELKRFCAWLPGASVPRLRVGPGFPVRANMALRKSCAGNTYSVATARGSNANTVNAEPEQWNSWLELREFGTAAHSGQGPRQDVPPTFVVDFGQRLAAERFHIELTDDKLLRAEARNMVPLPVPDVLGTLDGFFDFELQRGQGAQTFP
ncbi:MAG TPA: hypothetical protein VGG33_03270 [Polyangia bacterium]